MTIDIPRGSEVRDLASGATGTATSRFEALSGMVQYTVQPKAAEGAPIPDAWWIDVQQLEVVGPGISDRALPLPSDVHVKLGQKVRDKVTGFEGTVTTRTDYLNGCVHFTVQPKGKKDKRAEVEAFDYKRLEVIGEGVSAESKKPVPRSSTGGPTRRAGRPAF